MLVKGYADNAKPFIFVIVVCLYKVGHLLSTRAAPTGPKVYNGNLVFCELVSYGYVIAVDVGHGEAYP